MGFAAGLRAGNSVAGDWVDTYKQAKEEKITGGLREAMNAAQQDRMIKDEEGNMIEQAGMDILNSSPAEITTTVMNQFKANGGTVDDSTWNLVNGIVGEAAGLVGKYRKSQQDREVAGAREDNIRNTIFNRNRRAVSQIAKNERGTSSYGHSVTDAYRGKDYSNPENQWGITEKEKTAADDAELQIEDKKDAERLRRSIKTGKYNRVRNTAGRALKNKEKSKCSDGKLWSEKYQICLKKVN